jgi:hypothetical protein
MVLVPMNATESNEPPGWAMQAASEVARFLPETVLHRLATEGIAAIILKHAPREPERPPAILLPATPPTQRKPIRPFVSDQIAESLVPAIKHILVSRKQRVGQLAATLEVPVSDIELAISKPGSGLAIGKAGWVTQVPFTTPEV